VEHETSECAAGFRVALVLVVLQRPVANRADGFTEHRRPHDVAPLFHPNAAAALGAPLMNGTGPRGNTHDSARVPKRELSQNSCNSRNITRKHWPGVGDS